MDLSRIPGHPAGALKLYELLLAAFAVCGVFHWLYFLAAPYIWSQNIHVNPQDITPWIRIWIGEHDGVEIYALYVLMFACLAASLGALWLVSKTRGSRVYPGVIGWFVFTVGFHPPMNALAGSTIPEILNAFSKLVLILGALLAILAALQRWNVSVANAVVFILLIPVCLVAVAPISWQDYSYVLAPALRMLYGASLADIYFQYDLLLSLPAFAWMKLQLDISQFYVVGQASYVIFLFGIFLFARRLFAHPYLPYLFLVALVLVRMYSSLTDPVWCLQVTPLRLDWWLLLLVLIYRFGPYHWSVGAFCGAMVLLSRNFGIIYTLAYLQLLFTMIALEGDQRGLRSGWGTWGALLRQTLRNTWRNVALIVVGGLASFLLFSGEHSDSVYYYQRIGIGFMRIAEHSFYWYVPIVMSLVFAFAVRFRVSLPQKQLIISLLLVYVTIGNSIYFFGRSHENNIINISGSLLLLFFLLLDHIQRLQAGSTVKGMVQFLPRRQGVVLGAAFVLLILLSYGNKITSRAARQAQSIAHLQFRVSGLPSDAVEALVGKIKAVTRSSKRVYFACPDMDMWFTYFGGYAPVGYFNPFVTWLFCKDLVVFVQGLLDSGYYVVINRGPASFGLEIVLKYRTSTVVDEFVVLSK
jgi:hypothetical protein